MWDFSIGRALGLMMRPLPFALLRAAIHFGFTPLHILATGTRVGGGWGGLGSPARTDVQPFPQAQGPHDRHTGPGARIGETA